MLHFQLQRRKVKEEKHFSIQPLKMKPLHDRETSGTNYYVMRRRTPEELKRQLRRLFGVQM
jgi:acetolactate synthase regulatory subunit